MLTYKIAVLRRTTIKIDLFVNESFEQFIVFVA